MNTEKPPRGSDCLFPEMEDIDYNSIFSEAIKKYHTELIDNLFKQSPLLTYLTRDTK